MADLGLVLHPTADVRETVEFVQRWAQERDFGLLVVRDQLPRVAGIPVTAVTEAELVRRSTALLSLGGDGTMLGALRLTIGTGVPVLGVNLGHVGMLVEVGVAELPAALARINRGDFGVEPHPALRVSAPGIDGHAFNDVALVRSPGSGFVAASFEVDDRATGVYRCDAIVVATSIGSTADNYAAGGPIVSPAVQALVVTPSAPASGISRAMVVAPSEHLRLTLRPGCRDVALEVDGRVEGRLGEGDVVEIVAVPDAGHVVRLDAADYERRSRVKLSLLDLPLLPEELRALLPDRPDGRRSRHGDAAI